MVRRIIIFTASRSERGLLEPIIKRCKAHISLETLVHEFNPRSTSLEIDNGVKQVLKRFKPDAVLIPCDRREMVVVAARCFMNKIPIFHLYAGVSDTGSNDDINRLMISYCSKILLCESDSARTRLLKTGFAARQIHVVGCTHFDDVEIDTLLCPVVPYDLILINPSSSKAETIKNIREVIQRFNPSIRNIFIGPNEDPFSEEITLFIDKFVRLNADKHVNVPRPQFLGLLKNCRHFISNSSSAVYEAPYFGVKWIPIGLRNHRREKPPHELLSGASDKIVKLLVDTGLSR